LKKAFTFPFFLILLGIAFFNFYCNQNSPETVSPYLNHSDTIHYVGMEQCRACHPSIYESFIQTGMGQSFGRATKEKSTANFHNLKPVYDSSLNLYYLPHWLKDTLYITEFRLKGKDTIFKRTERVDYIIGSGQHTNSHLGSTNGFIYQLPLTWYAQKGKWDLPPGFEKGRNVRFSRAIEFECMSCHNAMPVLSPGSVNKFEKIPEGIDCERCHGPGEAHTTAKHHGIFIDTSTQIDYTIVNPRKLSWELQIDVCQRCHLQGNAILKPGKTFADFKPGMRLSDVYEVFLPKYEGKDDEFIMASHAQRLQLSKCFIESNKTNKSDPGKAFSSMNLTCITCHNPHVSVKVTGKQIFNNACLKCHQDNSCKEVKETRMLSNNNCVECHMPKSGSIDIPHVSVHDHKIKIPIKEKQLSDLKKFAGIYAVNAKESNAQTKANAYLNYFEKFEGEAISLDSANFYLNQFSDQPNFAAQKIHYLYLKNSWEEIILLAQTIDLKLEKDPWVCYRVGQAYQNLGRTKNAQDAYILAMTLAPDNLSFINKLGITYVELGEFQKAISLFGVSLGKQSKQADVWINLGFAYINVKQNEMALQAYNKALSLDPDNYQALLNRAALYNLLGKKNNAKKDLHLILNANPDNQQVKDLLKQLNSE
jgi:tetratricopeptide (TPR) repeat protein